MQTKAASHYSVTKRSPTKNLKIAVAHFLIVTIPQQSCRKHEQMLIDTDKRLELENLYKKTFQPPETYINQKLIRAFNTQLAQEPVSSDVFAVD